MDSHSENPPRGSTSQICLNKILSIINTVPPPVATKSREKSPEDENKVVDGFCISNGVLDEDGLGHGDRVSENSHIEIEGTERSMILLIAAAKLIFGELMDADGDKSVKKDEVAPEIEPIERKNEVAPEIEPKLADLEEAPPSAVVRSKRGRTRVLPGKFRDSVLEPLTRFSRTRSSVLPSKRARR